MNNTQRITVANLDTDPVSSAMLEQLKDALQNDPKVCNISTVHCPVENAKCGLVSALAFVVNGIILPGLTYDALKAVAKAIFARCAHPEGYQWRLKIDADTASDTASDAAELLSICQEHGVVVLRVMPKLDKTEKE